MADPVRDYLAPMERPIIVEFLTEAVKNEFRSRQEGRPVFEDREFVNIMIPGMRGTSAHEPVNDDHKARWPDKYAAFKAGLEAPQEGTSLRDWPNSALTKARVEELAYFNVRTVEHLAALDDNTLQKLGMGMRELRETARKFLEVAAKGTGPLEKLVRDKIDLEAQVARLTAELTEANAEAARLRAEKTHASA